MQVSILKFGSLRPISPSPIAQIYSDLDLEYFERALDWVLAREEVCGDNGAGLQGISQVELSK